LYCIEGGYIYIRHPLETLREGDCKQRPAGELDLARGDAALLSDVLKLAGDSVEDPGDDDALYVLPSKVVDGGIKENLIVPADVACRRMI
jgi:hypothetical protein